MSKNEERLVIDYPENFQIEVLKLFNGGEEDTEGVRFLLKRGSNTD